MENNLYTWASLVLAPVTGIVTWMVSRQKRQNETLRDDAATHESLLATISTLAEENQKLHNQIIKLLEANTELQKRINQMEIQLKKNIVRNEQL